MSTQPLADLLADLPIQRGAGDLFTPVSSVCYDSRQAEPGALFVALKGATTDGHRYLDDARRRGAVAVLVEEWSPAAEQFAAAAQTANTRAALALVAARFYGQPSRSLGVIGITGTDGKTTTSYMIDAMLRANGLPTGLIGTVTVRVGEQVIEHGMGQTTPESLEVQRLLARMRDEGVSWAVVEASSHGLELSRLDHCAFDIGVVTNITREHLDFHGTVENYRRAKARLLERVAETVPHGKGRPVGVVLNADDPGALSIASYAGGAPVILIGVERADVDITAASIELGPSGTSFRLTTPAGTAPARLRLVGAFNVSNALCAAGAGHLIGLDPEQIARGLESLDSVPGRLHRIDHGQPFAVYVDYAHTPAALEKTLRLVRSLVDGRVIVVFGSAGGRDRSNRPAQGRVGVELADLAIFTTDDPRFEDPNAIIDEIARGAAAAGAVEGREFLRIEDRRRAIATAMERAGAGDLVLLAGKGHEQCMIYGDEKRPWNDAAVAAEVLTALGYPAPEREGTA